MVSDVSDKELLSLIVGRELDSTFPEKHSVPAGVEANLVVRNLTGEGFQDINITGYPGQIIGH